MSQDDESGGTPPDQPSGQRRLILVSVAVVVALAVVGLVVYLMIDDGAETADGTDVPTITGSAPPTTRTTVSTPSAQVPAPSSAQVSTPSTAPPPAQDDPAAAKSVAEQAAGAISSGDVATIATLSCDPVASGQDDGYPSDAKAEVVGEPQITGDTATVDLRLTIADTEPTIVPMPLTKQDGRWCIP